MWGNCGIRNLGNINNGKIKSKRNGDERKVAICVNAFTPPSVPPRPLMVIEIEIEYDSLSLLV